MQSFFKIAFVGFWEAKKFFAMCFTGDRYVLKDGVDKETVKKVFELSEDEYNQIKKFGIINPYTKNLCGEMVYIIAFLNKRRTVSYDDINNFFNKK